MKKDKFRLILMAAITLLVLITAAVYGFASFFKENANMASLFPLGIILLIILFMGFFIIRRYKDVKTGQPLEDERSKRVVTNAAAKSFYVSLYWLLAIGWFEPFFAKIAGQEHLTASQATGGGIAGMALLFFGFWFYYNGKGKLV